MQRSRCPSLSASLPFVFTAIAMLLASSSALGEPIKYTGFTITDGQLGTWKFHNARLVLTFESDTNNVQMLAKTCVGTNAAFNSTGVARVTIVDHEKVVTARLNPNQIFVSFDQDEGGVGFGSFGPGYTAPSCTDPTSLQPAYPLGLHHGTMDGISHLYLGYSANQEAFPVNLQGNVGFSGKGFTCVGIPEQDCEPATVPLITDHGDLFLLQPYTQTSSTDGTNDPLGGAFFFQETGHSGLPLPASVLAPSSTRANGSITYHLLLVSDVSLDGKLYQNASIHLSFQSRISEVTPLADGGPNGAVNTHGQARVEIRQGGRTVSANFEPGQIYVYFDSATASAGFGSFSGGRGYPAVIAPTYVHIDTELLAAVADILTTGSRNYSSATVDLAYATDLKHETMVADYVSSCTDIDFSLGVCYNLPSSRRLLTDKGDFYLEQPYNVAPYTDPSAEIRNSNNWGVFWTTFAGDE
jgi:hypothetical protein